jgi:hypothetical protein
MASAGSRLRQRLRSPPLASLAAPGRAPSRDAALAPFASLRPDVARGLPLRELPLGFLTGGARAGAQLNCFAPLLVRQLHIAPAGKDAAAEQGRRPDTGSPGVDAASRDQLSPTSAAARDDSQQQREVRHATLRTRCTLRRSRRSGLAVALH